MWDVNWKKIPEKNKKKNASYLFFQINSKKSNSLSRGVIPNFFPEWVSFFLTQEVFDFLNQNYDPLFPQKISTKFLKIWEKVRLSFHF